MEARVGAVHSWAIVLLGEGSGAIGTIPLPDSNIDSRNRIDYAEGTAIDVLDQSQQERELVTKDPQFLELVRHLSRRPGMYVQPANYRTVVSYLSGYDHAATEAGRPSVLDAFSEWLHVKVGHHCSVHWSGVILQLFAGNDEEVAQKRLMEFLVEFLEQTEEESARNTKRYARLKY